MEHIIFFVFLQKFPLLEKKWDIKLITLISMHHLKPLVSLGRLIKNQNADALYIGTVQILCITAFHKRILWTVCVV